MRNSRAQGVPPARIRGASSPAINRRAEEEPRLLLFFFISLALVGMITIIVAVVVLASTNASKAVLADQEQIDIYSQAVTSALYSILSVRYADETEAACVLSDDFSRPASITMRFNTRLTPETCSIFVNGALLRSERRIEADCGTTCPFADYNRQFSLGEFDYRDRHVIRVCCNDICLDKALEPLC